MLDQNHRVVTTDYLVADRVLEIHGYQVSDLHGPRELVVDVTVAIDGDHYDPMRLLMPASDLAVQVLRS